MAGRYKRAGDDGVIMRTLKSTSVLDEDCLVVKTDADGIVEPCDNAAVPYGVAYRSTKDRIANSVGISQNQTGAQVDGKVAVFRSGIAELPLDIDHGAINFGTAIYVGPSDNGKVVGGADPSTTAGALLLVGWAEEKIAAPAGGQRTKATVRVALALARGGAP